MSQRKFIYWRDDFPKKDGKRFANVHLLVGYNQDHITDYMEMAEELRKTFPDATNDKIICSKVIESDSFKAFSLIAYNAYIEENKYEEWYQEHSKINYWWY
jgi:hypothetical protein